MWRRSPSGEQAADWRALADRLDLCAGLITEGPAASRMAAAISSLEGACAETGGRSHQRHAATGMPTREPLLERMRQDGQGMLGVIRFLDFDRLSTFDPALGELLLRAAGERLRAMLQAERLLAHVDRADLAIWFGPRATEASARSEMEAIEYALGEALQVGERTILPKASARIVTMDAEDPATTLARTLAQLSLAAGPASQAAGPLKGGLAEREQFAFEQDLRLAMDRGELSLCYQPLVEAGEARICGAEALIRWQSARRGAVPPAEFVPVMEAMGLAHELGMWVLNTAARDARAWQARGLSDLRIAVNVSGHQLERSDLATLIERTLNRHSLAPGALEIELTEGVAMVDCARAERLFADIRALGIGIAIDDFGTGYSSLSVLRKLAFDKIKIDREFVTEVDSRKDSQAICQSIIALARGLGIRVLAEGVERAEEYQWLRMHGCGFFQGFYFSPPLSPAAFVAFAEDAAALPARLAIDPRQMQHDISERLSA